MFFDVPETKRSARVALIRTLRSLGFQMLQRSIWIHPFACKAIIARVSTHYSVQNAITYVEVDHIDGSKDLEKRFIQLLRE